MGAVQQKGGVGKSTIIAALAALAGRSSALRSGDEDAVAPVAAAGIDPQGTLEQWCDRVEGREGHKDREDVLPFDYLITRSRLGLVPKVAGQEGRKRVYVDTPGFMDEDPDAEWGADPLGEGRAADALREVLDLMDFAIVPITESWLTHEQAEYTIERVLRPRNIPFLVVINMHDPNTDSKFHEAPALTKTKLWADQRNYPRTADPIRRYNIHEHAAENGLLVTEYKMSGTALKAREDFLNLALTVEQML
ncbi:hypothetical protein AN218_08155 [Streptomyces nanshensis]|uniref:CobQ/CobB/MinD/ParA nucleotide binding domain-containing protein n=1 Tax=Streptomyces nanshensis TaxID=518642 RepID=A0A1E7L8H9_9ACTN|nr:hypothetical protein AN218_08155 [Streptomyces nanshensis]